jgi:hypothetical protein
MASIVLGVAGAVIGSYIPGVGAAMGWQLGSALGGMLSGSTKTSEIGPRLGDLRVQYSTWGTMIPILYGTNRVAGNVIWSSGIKETVHVRYETYKTKGGPGSIKQKITTYTYSIDLAISLGVGKINSISKIWVSGNAIMDSSDGRIAAAAINIEKLSKSTVLYEGSEFQEPSSLIESYLGVGNVPAYRGQAYFVIEALELESFGNRVPNLEFLVSRTISGYTPELTKGISKFSNINTYLSQYSESVRTDTDMFDTYNHPISVGLKTIEIKKDYGLYPTYVTDVFGGTPTFNGYEYKIKTITRRIPYVIITKYNIREDSIVATWEVDFPDVLWGDNPSTYITSSNIEMGRDGSYYVHLAANTGLGYSVYCSGIFNSDNKYLFGNNGGDLLGGTSNSGKALAIDNDGNVNWKVFYVGSFGSDTFNTTFIRGSLDNITTFYPYDSGVNSTVISPFNGIYTMSMTTDTRYKSFNRYVEEYQKLNTNKTYIFGEIGNYIYTQYNTGDGLYPNSGLPYGLGNNIMGYAYQDPSGNTTVFKTLIDGVNFYGNAHQSEYGGILGTPSDKYLWIQESVFYNPTGSSAQIWLDYESTADIACTIELWGVEPYILIKSFNIFEEYKKAIDRGVIRNELLAHGSTTYYYTKRNVSLKESTGRSPWVTGSDEIYFPFNITFSVDPVWGGDTSNNTYGLTYIVSINPLSGSVKFSEGFTANFNINDLLYQTYGDRSYGNIHFSRNAPSTGIYATNDYRSFINGLGNNDNLPITLSDIITDICSSVGISSNTIDVSTLTSISIPGYALTRISTGLASISQLLDFFLISTIESEGKLKFSTKKYTADLAIPEDDLINTDSLIEVSRVQETSLPKRLTTIYINSTSDYLQASEYAERLTTKATSLDTNTVAISMSPTMVANYTNAQLYSLYASRNSYIFETGYKYKYVEVGDVVSINNKNILVTKKLDDTTIKFEGVSISPTIYSSAKPTSNSVVQEVLILGNYNSSIDILNLPMLRSEDASGTSYASISGTTDRFSGSDIVFSTDNLTYNEITSINHLSDYGTVLTSPACYWSTNTYNGIDNNSYVYVTSNIALASYTRDQILADYKLNLCLIGTEIIQFLTATLISTNTYKLSGFLRGLYGTHTVKNINGSLPTIFKLINTNLVPINLPSSYNNTDIFLKSVSFGVDEASSNTLELIYKPSSLIPLAPSHAIKIKQPNGDFLIKWVRSNRWDYQLTDNYTTPLTETEEKYMIKVYKNSSLAEDTSTIFYTNTQSFLLTAALQTSIWGAPLTSPVVDIAQVSSTVGEGNLIRAL